MDIKIQLESNFHWLMATARDRPCPPMADQSTEKKLTFRNCSARFLVSLIFSTRVQASLVYYFVLLMRSVYILFLFFFLYVCFLFKEKIIFLFFVLSAATPKKKQYFFFFFILVYFNFCFTNSIGVRVPFFLFCSLCAFFLLLRPVLYKNVRIILGSQKKADRLFLFFAFSSFFLFLVFFSFCSVSV